MNNQKQNSSGGRKPKLLDQVRYVIRAKHYSIRTEEAYVDWIQGVGYSSNLIIIVFDYTALYFFSCGIFFIPPPKRFILFHNKRHPEEMGEKEINQFLTHLAVQGVG